MNFHATQLFTFEDVQKLRQLPPEEQKKVIDGIAKLLADRTHSVDRELVHSLMTEKDNPRPA